MYQGKFDNKNKKTNVWVFFKQIWANIIRQSASKMVWFFRMHLGHFLLNGGQQMANKKAVDKALLKNYIIVVKCSNECNIISWVWWIFEYL